MIEPRIETQTATDGYPIHVAVWPVTSPMRGRVVIIHGVQSHGGWYHNLGRVLAAAGYEAHFPDRRGSGANMKDRGDTTSARRLIEDVAERLQELRGCDPHVPIALTAISWGGKTAIITAASHPELVDALALVCPGLTPRVGVTRSERLRIAWAYLTNRRKMFSIPLSDPALFTGERKGQEFIAADPLSLRSASAGLLAASTFLDRMVRSALLRINQPALLMLSGKDRIVDNPKTQAAFDLIPSRNKQVIAYPEAHHTLEFEPDPNRYAHDLIAWFDQILNVNPGAKRH